MLRQCLVALVPLLLIGCPRQDTPPAPPLPPPEIFVHHPAEPDPGLGLALQDLVSDLRRMGAVVHEADLPAPACTEAEVHILVLGHAHDETGAAAISELPRQAFAASETRCDDRGRRIVLRGGSVLSGQWAVYDLLERLGVRYWHPEHTLYPGAPAWPETPIEYVEAPDFVERWMNAHRTHPIELSAPLDDAGLDMAAHQRRWIDWSVKMRLTQVGGWDTGYVGTHAYDRGFPRGSGFNLLNSQQGGRPILDPDDPRPEEAQLAEALDTALAPREGLPPVSHFSFQFNPSEFTEADDQDTVRRLTFITDYLTQNHPELAVWTINHGTAGEPTPNYGVRFFDLPQFAPPELGVKVHTLMFYDLERPAPVYGNDDFSHLLAWIRDQQAVRRVVHYPESSWWLTFDLPVPLFLSPATIEARAHDVALIREHLAAEGDATGLYGHQLFTTGQEWGYWLIDYCFARISWNADFDDDACFADFADRFRGADEILAVLQAVRDRQVADMRDTEILRLLVGSDDETEVAEQVGIRFHPLPAPPAAVLGWDQARAAALQDDLLPRLSAMGADYHAWSGRIETLIQGEREEARPWIRELRDGLRVFALRAEHAVEVYSSALALRSALAANDLSAIDAAAAGVESARGVTEAARAVVRAREAEYRYPAALTIAGGEPGSDEALPNKTIYPYRYLSRTHRMFYWTRPDDQLAALFGEGLEVVQVDRRILLAGTGLRVDLLAEGVTDLRMDWGDGTVAGTLDPHTYAAEGLYAWTLDATTTTGVVHHEDDAAVVARRLVFPKGSLEVIAPEGVALVEALLPGFVVGLGVDAAPFTVLGRLDGEPPTSTRGTLVRRDRAGAVSGPADLALSLLDVGDLVVRSARIEIAEGTGPEDRRLLIDGEMVTQDVIDLLVSVGGFDEPGARKLVADLLDYTPETLPERLAFEIRAAGVESP